MAGPVMGSGANERLNNKKTEVTFNWQITSAAAAANMAFAALAPTVGGEAGLALANGAGVVLPTVVFAAILATGANPIIGLEFKDSTVQASALIMDAQGSVYTTAGANNADLGCDVYWTGAQYVVAGTGIALNLQLGQTAIGNSRLDQAPGSIIKFSVTVRYLPAQ